MVAKGLGIPQFRGQISGSYVYWTIADQPPLGALDVQQMPTQTGTASPSPYDIPDLLMWYRADFGVVTSGSEEFVTEWKDVSGNRFHMVQPTAGSRPQFTGSLPLLNDQPVVHFRKFASTTQTLTCSHDALQSPRQLTAFVAGTMDTDWQTFNTFISKASTSSWADGWALSGRAGASTGFWMNSWNNYVQKAYNLASKVKVIGSGRNSTVVSYKSNSNFIGTLNTASYSPATAVVRMGDATTNYGCNGDIGEIIVFGRALSDAEVTTVESYLGAKFGLGDQ